MQVERVQKWVMSTLLTTVLFIFASGLALFGQHLPARNGADVGLVVIAAFIGVTAILGIRVINSRPLLTPWLVLGVVPALVGWYVGTIT
ncbi:MAG: transcriptional regulator [Marmoricola sp.]